MITTVLRQLAKRPLFAAVAVLTIALGTGAATAIYTVVDHVLLRPLPYPDAGRLVALCETNESIPVCVASPANAADWASRSRSLASVGQGRSWNYVLQHGEARSGVSAGWATPGLFVALGVRPAMGRLIDDDDLARDRTVALLTDDIWRAQFGADSGIVGRTIGLDGKAYEIIGVLPPSAGVPRLGYVRLWVPMPADPRSEARRGWRGFVTIARLAPGSSRQAAQAELSSIQAGLARLYPDVVGGWGVAVRPLLDEVVGPVRATLYVFLAAVVVVLLVACANLAHLLLWRGAGRAREFAIRSAIGAPSNEVFRLVLQEAVILTVVGGAFGLLLAAWATDVFLALLPVSLPRGGEVRMDFRVAAIGLAVTLLCGHAAGWLPARRASRLAVSDVLKAGQRGGGVSRGVRGMLVLAEFALAFVLAVGGGLLARTFAATMRWDPGFDREGLVTFWTVASTEHYANRQQVAALFARVSGDLATLPGVTSVGMTSSGPLFGGEESGEFVVAGQGDDEPLSARWYDMSPAFFPTLGLALRRGRLFDDRDVPGAPRVAIINEAMARRYWSGADPIGRRLRFKTGAPDDFMEVVGVVADIPPFTPGTETAPEIYWPYAQSPRWASYFVLRTEPGTGDLTRAIEGRLAAIDQDLRASRVQPMSALVNEGLRRSRFNMLLIGVFAAVSLLLTAIGAYGVMASAWPHEPARWACGWRWARRSAG